jgi:hypothetical protein
MNWLKENALLTGLCLATVIVGGVLLFLMMRSMTQYQETLDGYQQAVRRLHALQNRAPFPSAENLQKSRIQADNYKAELSSLREELAKLQAPNSPGVQPQKFQDDLRVAVNEIVERAAAAGVELPKGFYLGFSQYANSLPNEHVAPVLARQLRVIERVVNNLIDFKVQSIDSLHRLPLLEESSTAPTSQSEEARKRGNQPTPKPNSYTRLPFDLAFTAEQGKLQLAFNSLLDSDYFLIVRNLAVQNTARVGPAISRPDGLARVTATPPTKEPTARAERSPDDKGSAPGGSAPSESLNVILGRELVKASMRIEIIDFSRPPEPKG